MKKLAYLISKNLVAAELQKKLNLSKIVNTLFTNRDYDLLQEIEFSYFFRNHDIKYDIIEHREQLDAFTSPE